LPSWADGPAVDRPVRSSRRLLTEGGVVVSTTPTQEALQRLVAKLAKQSPADIQAGNPGEAGHTGTGIKPGDRYDSRFNAHPAKGAATRNITSGLLLGFLDVAGVVQPNPFPLLSFLFHVYSRGRYHACI
jgi:hypothetical protein